MNTLDSKELVKEFDRQLDNLLQKGYPKAANLTVDEFLKIVTPLKEKIKNIKAPEINLDKGILPFVIVIKSDLVDTDKAMSFVEREGKQGLVKLFPLQPKDFNPIEEVNLSKSSIYLLVDIDRGRENINLPPSEAMKLIKNAQRSPLTIDEGVAIVSQFPEFLQKNNCFSLLASRHTGDKRVPAIWISGEKRPNLGWCWDGNPHTWLGSASCFERIA